MKTIKIPKGASCGMVESFPSVVVSNSDGSVLLFDTCVGGAEVGSALGRPLVASGVRGDEESKV